MSVIGTVSFARCASEKEDQKLWRLPPLLESHRVVNRKVEPVALPKVMFRLTMPSVIRAFGKNLLSDAQPFAGGLDVLS